MRLWGGHNTVKKERIDISSKNPKCLLLGNGINLLFNDPSWKLLITDELKQSHSSLSYEDIKSMPATMQIVVATGDAVNERMKFLSARLLESTMSRERITFLQRILSLPVDDIMTANYSFELEAADGMELSKKKYSSLLQSTFELKAKHRSFRLYQYYLTDQGKRIWHVHGDLAKPDTMLMGHYYYAKHLKALQECIAKTIRRYKICQEKGEEFKSYSWVDQFLTGEVFILGLGMYLCESDLWYLLCCKKRNFPDTRTWFYNYGKTDLAIDSMLKAYNVKVIDEAEMGTHTEYMDFYMDALRDIDRRLTQK